MKKSFSDALKALLILLIPIFAITKVAHCLDENVPQILILNSYHQGYEITDEKIQGIQSVFSAANLTAEFYIEYMDCKRFKCDSAYQQEFRDVLEKKFGKTQFNLAITTENEALDFAIQNREQLFPGLPMVFVGIDDFKPERLQGQKGITGVNETVDYKDILNLIIQTRPQTSKIQIIHDKSASGLTHRANLMALQPLFARQLNFDFLPPSMPLESLAKEAASLNNDTAILLFGALTNAAGHAVPMRIGLGMLTKVSTAPIFCATDARVRYGCIGGRVKSNLRYGEVAGSMAIDILHGKSPEEIPVVLNSVNPYMFNYPELQRFNVPENLLPPNSILLFKPETFFEKHAPVIIASISVIATLSIIIIALIISIKQRRLAHRLAIERESNYREIFNATNEVILLHDTSNGAIIDVNKRFEDVFGYSVAEANSLSLDDISSGANSFNEETAQKYIAQAANGKPQFFEWEVRRKDGSSFFAEVTLRKTEIGGKNRVLAVVRDITEKKFYEERLRQSEKMDSLGQLAGGIAHDFNNMLAGITAAAELLAPKIAQDAQVLRYTNMIIESATKAANLTKQLLAFSRKSLLQTTAVDIHDCIRSTLEILQRTIDRKVTLHCSLEANRHTVNGDASQIESAILNLFLNARDAMPEGGTLSVSTQIAHFDSNACKSTLFAIQPGDYIEITIKDSGIGMSEDVRRRIFEPFFTTKPRGKGTGLGLAAVHGMIETHRGTISVESEPGHGSTFKISLPLVNETVKPTQEKQIAETRPHSGCILVVDDEPIVRMAATEALQTMGYFVYEATDGLEALEVYDKHQAEISLVLLDMVMPRMDGRETYIALRQRNAQLPVVVCSGYTPDASIMGPIAKEVEVLQKPYRQSELVSIIEKALDRSKKNR